MCRPQVAGRPYQKKIFEFPRALGFLYAERAFCPYKLYFFNDGLACNISPNVACILSAVWSANLTFLIRADLMT